MLFAPSAQKTLSNIIRDYRQGALTNPPGLGSGNEVLGPGEILGITYGQLKFQPGEIVPLVTDAPTPGLSLPADITDEIYQQAAVFGPSKKTFYLREMEAESTNNTLSVKIVQFGVALDFISSSQYGAVQISGYVWVPFEDVPELETARKFVVLRKNTRYGGKQYLQAAADGVAEIIRTDTSRPREDGLTWGLIRLGTPYRGTLSRLPQMAENLEPQARVFRVQSIEDENVGKILSVSDDLKSQFAYPQYVIGLDYYDAQKQNFVQVKSVCDLDLSTHEKYIYVDRKTGIISSSALTNGETDVEQWPDYINIHGKAEPFRGGFFPAECTSKTEIVVLGRTLSRSQLTTKEHNVDIWPGDSLYVRIFNPDTYGSYCEPYELVHCPKDDPTGTRHLYVGGMAKYSDGHRGWKYVDLKNTWQAQNPNSIGVLVGNQDFLPFTVHHKHQDSDDIAYLTEDVSRVDFQEFFSQVGYFEKVEYGMEFNHGL